MRRPRRVGGAVTTYFVWLHGPKKGAHIPAYGGAENPLVSAQLQLQVGKPGDGSIKKKQASGWLLYAHANPCKTHLFWPSHRIWMSEMYWNVIYPPEKFSHFGRTTRLPIPTKEKCGGIGQWRCWKLPAKWPGKNVGGYFWEPQKVCRFEYVNLFLAGYSVWDCLKTSLNPLRTSSLSLLFDGGSWRVTYPNIVLLRI